MLTAPAASATTPTGDSDTMPDDDTTSLDQPLHGEVAAAIILALRAFPYSASVDLPTLDRHGAHDTTALDIVRALQALSGEVQRASVQAQDAYSELLQYRQDVAALRRLIGTAPISATAATADAADRMLAEARARALEDRRDRQRHQ